MFALEIGLKLNQSGNVGLHVNDRQEKDLANNGYDLARNARSPVPPRNIIPVMVKMTLPGEFDRYFVPTTVSSVQGICKLPASSLCHLGVWGPGRLDAPGFGMLNGHAGNCDFRVVTIGDHKPITGLCVTIHRHPRKDFPMLVTFEDVARYFILVMKTLRRVRDAERHVSEHHNLAAASDKLSRVPGQLAGLAVLLRDHWQYRMQASTGQ
jgi:hypothetical protein